MTEVVLHPSVNIAIWLTGSLGLALYLAISGKQRKSLSTSGAVAALVVGTLHVGASLPHGITLIFFYLSSSKLTKVGAQQKVKLEDNHKEGGQRDAYQVLFNSLGACLAILMQITLTAKGQGEQARALCTAAFLAHYACVAGDTWASELGILATNPPRLITSPWRTVPAGTNGGVTSRGVAASLIAGLSIGSVWVVSVALVGVLAQHVQGSLVEVSEVLKGTQVLGGAVGVVVLCGAFAVFGALLDSLLGATLQFSGWNDERKVVVGQPGTGVKHISGLNVMNNGMVNLCASLITAGMGVWMAFTLSRSA